MQTGVLEPALRQAAADVEFLYTSIVAVSGSKRHVAESTRRSSLGPEIAIENTFFLSFDREQMNGTTGFGLKALILSAAAALNPCGAAVIVDQSNPDPVGALLSVSAAAQGASPVGQSFTPMSSGVDFVTFYLRNVGTTSVTGVFVSIYPGVAFTGSPLGTSQAASVPTGTGSGSDIEFDFANRVPLTAGSLYSFIITSPNDPQGNVALVVGDNTYTRGMLITAGIARDGSDAGFSEGIFVRSAAVPEPESFGLVGLGLAALAATRRKRTRLADRSCDQAIRG